MMRHGQSPGLIGVAALLLRLTGAGLYYQHVEAQSAFIALAQGALYLAAVWLVLRGGSSRSRVALILAAAALTRGVVGRQA
jgi:hypothetical protein